VARDRYCTNCGQWVSPQSAKEPGCCAGLILAVIAISFGSALGDKIRSAIPNQQDQALAFAVLIVVLVGVVAATTKKHCPKCKSKKALTRGQPR